MVNGVEIVYCEECGKRIKSRDDWATYYDSDLCVECYNQSNKD